MLNFLLGYIVGSASSQPSAPVTPMSSEEVLLWTGFVIVAALLFFSWFMRGVKRGL